MFWVKFNGRIIDKEITSVTLLGSTLYYGFRRVLISGHYGHADGSFSPSLSQVLQGIPKLAVQESPMADCVLHLSALAYICCCRLACSHWP